MVKPSQEHRRYVESILRLKYLLIELLSHRSFLRTSVPLSSMRKLRIFL